MPHCPECGQPNRSWQGTRHLQCTACNAIHWQNPAPAASLAALRDGNILLSLRARPPNERQWDLVGGFIEPGETADDAMRRETLEETGCQVQDLRLERTAPGDYAGKPTLNLLYTGRLEGDPVPADDSLELRWWPLDALPPMAWPQEEAFVRDLARRLG